MKKPASLQMCVEVKASADNKSAEILIYDTIGEDFWTGEGVTAKRIAEQLKNIGDVEVRRAEAAVIRACKRAAPACSAARQTGTTGATRNTTGSSRCSFRRTSWRSCRTTGW